MKHGERFATLHGHDKRILSTTLFLDAASGFASGRDSAGAIKGRLSCSERRFPDGEEALGIQPPYPNPNLSLSLPDNSLTISKALSTVFSPS